MGSGQKTLALIVPAAERISKDVGLEVFKTNEEAKSFYYKHGFYVEGETPSSLIMVHA